MQFMKNTGRHKSETDVGRQLTKTLYLYNTTILVDQPICDIKLSSAFVLIA